MKGKFRSPPSAPSLLPLFFELFILQNLVWCLSSVYGVQECIPEVEQQDGLSGSLSNRIPRRTPFSLRDDRKSTRVVLLIITLCCSLFSNCSGMSYDPYFMIELFKNYPPFRNDSETTSSPSKLFTIGADSPPPPSLPSSDIFSYGGGPEPSYILENPISVYIIWYGNWTYKGSLKDRSVLTNFIDSLSYQLPSTVPYSNDTNATVSGWWDIVQTFYNPISNKHVSGNITIVRQVFDNFSFGINLSQPMVEELVESHIGKKKKSLPADKDGLYIVFVSGDVCYRGVSWDRTHDQPCTVCLGCGFHGSFKSKHTNSIQTLSYAYVANAYGGNSVCIGSCMPQRSLGAHTVNNNTGIDGMVNVLAHEMAESATDKGGVGRGWALSRDSSSEIADYCQSRFQNSFYADDLQSRFNLIGKGGMKFLVQQVFRLRCGCLLQASDCKLPPPASSSPPALIPPPPKIPPPPPPKSSSSPKPPSKPPPPRIPASAPPKASSSFPKPPSKPPSPRTSASPPPKASSSSPKPPSSKPPTKSPQTPPKSTSASKSSLNQKYPPP